MVQTSYGDINDFAVDAGVRVGLLESDRVLGLTAGGGAQKVATVVVDTAANSTAYTYTCNAGTVTYTSDASGTKIEIAAGLAAAHNASALAASAGFAVSDGVDTVTVTGREVNDDFSISDSDGNLTTSTTTAASAGSAIPFGIGVVHSAFDECGLPGAGTAQVDTLTPVAVHNATYTVTITGDFGQDGITEVYTATYLADGSSTIAEITAGLTLSINLVMPANSVLAADGATVLTLTAENPGVGFSTAAGGDLALAVVAIVNTTANSTGGRFAGVAIKIQRVETTTANEAEYAADDVVDVLAEGEIMVLLDAGSAPAIGDPVYMRNVAGASEQLGAFMSAADGDDSTLLPNCYWTKAVGTGRDGSTLVAGLMVKV